MLCSNVRLIDVQALRAKPRYGPRPLLRWRTASASSYLPTGTSIPSSGITKVASGSDIMWVGLSE